jgi:hypothetical protein
METSGDRRNVAQAVLGLVLVVGGVTALLDRLGVIDVDWGWIWSHGWPVVIIAVGVAALLTTPRAPVGPLAIIALGALLLIAQLDGVDLDVWGVLWPLAVIIVGIAIISGGRRRSPGDQDTTISAFVFWWGTERKPRTQDFQGGSLTAIMGGIEVDLRQAWVQQRAQIAVFAMMGGVEIKVPAGWRVEVRGLPILGGWDDKTTPPLDPDAPVLRVDATCVMGGMEIKN